MFAKTKAFSGFATDPSWRTRGSRRPMPGWSTATMP